MLRKLGQIERTLLILDWLWNLELYWCVDAGLNNGGGAQQFAPGNVGCPEKRYLIPRGSFDFHAFYDGSCP